MLCINCNNENGEILKYKDKTILICEKCFVEKFKEKKPIGRQTIGITKKVSLTLPKNIWSLIKQNGNTSETIRKLIHNENLVLKDEIYNLNKQNTINNYNTLETKKISLTITEEIWKKIEVEGGKKSKRIRNFILNNTWN